MATLALQNIGLAGTTVTPVAAAVGGDVLPPGDHVFLRVVNGSGGSITATVDSAQQCSFGFDHDLAVAVGAGVTKDIGPLPAGRFAQSDGQVHVTYSAVTSVTVAAVSA